MATESVIKCKGMSMNTVLNGDCMWSEPSTFLCGTTGSWLNTSMVMVGEVTTIYWSKGPELRAGDTETCANGLTTLGEIGMVHVHLTDKS